MEALNFVRIAKDAYVFRSNIVYDRRKEILYHSTCGLASSTSELSSLREGIEPSGPALQVRQALSTNVLL